MDSYDGYIIAVDKGVEYALDNNINIDIAIGDFDSISIELPANIKKLELNSIKDETDLKVAVEYALSMNPDKVYIYGATNGRLDHYLANINLLGLGNIEIVDEVNRVFVKSSSFLTNFPGYISFLYYDGNPVISLEGFKYSLKDYELKNHDSLCVSNEVVTNGHVEIKNGRVLVIFAKKEKG